jgi:hypothetical protein
MEILELSILALVMPLRHVLDQSIFQVVMRQHKLVARLCYLRAAPLAVVLQLVVSRFGPVTVQQRPVVP